MKESAPEEIDGVDVTNIPERDQEQYLNDVNEAKRMEAALPAARGEIAYARTLEEAYPQGVKLAEGKVAELEAGVEVAKRNARDWVEEKPDIDIDKARVEMERSLKRQSEKLN